MRIHSDDIDKKLLNIIIIAYSLFFINLLNTYYNCNIQTIKIT